MKKRIELSEVKKQILSGLAEFQEDHVDYYLHMSEDGDIVSDVAHADESFIYSVPYERYGFGIEDIEADQCNDFCTIKDAIYAHEVDGDEIFTEIAKSLCSQANKWLEEQEEGEYKMRSNMKNLITVYPLRQAVWGADRPITKYFRTAQEREEYLLSHQYCDKMRACKLDLNEHISNNPDGFGWRYNDEKEPWE